MKMAEATEPIKGSEVDRPSLAVVIASVNGYRYVAQCLDSLAKQRDKEHGEVIVVEASGDDTAERTARSYPWSRSFRC